MSIRRNTGLSVEAHATVAAGRMCYLTRIRLPRLEGRAHAKPFTFSDRRPQRVRHSATNRGGIRPAPDHSRKDSPFLKLRKLCLAPIRKGVRHRSNGSPG